MIGKWARRKSGRAEPLAASSGLSGLWWVGCLWGPLAALQHMGLGFWVFITKVDEDCMW